MTDTVPLLARRAATKRYNGIPALLDASLDLFGGEVHALMGENGAGKSTLIKLLGGATTADSIQIALRGIPTTLANPQAAYRLGLRFIYQELNVVPQLSAAENIFLSQPYPKRLGMFVNWGRLYREANTALNAIGAGHIRPHIPMARLSPGNQMLVCIARAFLSADGSSVSIYVMDEPTAALSRHETELLFRVIDNLRQQGCAILYVSHRMDEIFAIADRVTVLRDGQVVASQPIHAVSPDELISQMIGRKLQSAFPPREHRLSDEKAPSSPVLEVHHLTTSDLHDISFTLHNGEILGVAGLVGSGRTELLRVLMGVDRPSQGKILLNGASQKRRTPTCSWHNGMVYVPEERRTQGLILSRSVTDNVTLPHLRYFSHFGLFQDHPLESRLTHELGAAVNLRFTGHRQHTRELSGGNQQKVMFARALARSPRVMLLDEPTRGIDMGAKFDIYSLIRQASTAGTGILMVSSDLPELLGLCDRILVMRRGQLVTIIEAAGLTEENLLALCYGEVRRDAS
jgi:ribose transport system ATP-binding protein